MPSMPNLEPRSGRALARALCALSSALLLACGGGAGEDDGRTLESGIWPSAAPPWPALSEPEAGPAMRAARIGSVLVEAATVESGGGLQRLPVSPPLSGLATVLVVRASWSTLEGLGRGELGELAEQLVLTAVDWESARATVRGIHLLPSAPLEDRERASTAIARLRRALPERLPLSLHVAPELLAVLETFDDLARAPATLICEVYGQPWEQSDRAERWDLEQSVERARRADALRRPFVAAIALEGRIFDPASGDVAARGLDAATLRASLPAIEGAFSYEGYHRQLLDLTPERAVDALGAGPGIATLEPRRTVRIARPTAQHLAALVRRLSEERLAHLEGFLWTGGGGASVAAVPVTRLPEVVSGSVASGLVLRMSGDRATGALRVELRNGSDPTGWADRDYNRVEIALAGGAFGAVELGGFTRIELDTTSSDRPLSPMERLRRADRLRLYFVSLEPGATVASGEIRVRPAKPSWSATASATVLGPAGEVEEIVEGSDGGVAEAGRSDSGAGS